MFILTFLGIFLGVFCVVYFFFREARKKLKYLFLISGLFLIYFSIKSLMNLKIIRPSILESYYILIHRLKTESLFFNSENYNYFFNLYGSLGVIQQFANFDLDSVDYAFSEFFTIATKSPIIAGIIIMLFICNIFLSFHLLKKVKKIDYLYIIISLFTLNISIFILGIFTNLGEIWKYFFIFIFLTLLYFLKYYRIYLISACCVFVLILFPIKNWYEKYYFEKIKIMYFAGEKILAEDKLLKLLKISEKDLYVRAYIQMILDKDFITEQDKKNVEEKLLKLDQNNYLNLIAEYKFYKNLLENNKVKEKYYSILNLLQKIEVLSYKNKKIQIFVLNEYYLMGEKDKAKKVIENLKIITNEKEIFDQVNIHF